MLSRCSTSVRTIAPKRAVFARCLSSTKFEFLTREQKGIGVWVTLNRPDVHNAFNEHVIAEITKAFHTITDDFPTARAVVLTGAGASFSAGADISWMQKMASYSEQENKADALKLFDMVHSIKKCPLPTIARINGAALGGGAGLVSACDIGYSVNSAVFGFTEVGIGLIPAVISRFVMDKIGKSNCSRYFLTGERFKGDRAKEIGLVSETFASFEELDGACEKTLGYIAKASPAAVAKSKLLIESVSNMTISQSRDHTSGEIAAIRVSKEGQAGLQAFLKKTNPPWVK